ncbi:hypothetical protein Tco_1564390 [Tanacetum coccineum]
MPRSLKNPKKAKRKNKVGVFDEVIGWLWYWGGAKKREGSSSSLNGMSSISAKVWEPGVDGLEEGEELRSNSEYGILQKLDSDRQAPVVPFDEIKSILRGELAGSMDSIYEYIDPTPLASALIAQERNNRIFKDSLKSSVENFKGIVEVIKYKLFGITIKESKVVTDMEVKWKISCKKYKQKPQWLVTNNLESFGYDCTPLVVLSVQFGLGRKVDWIDER